MVVAELSGQALSSAAAFLSGIGSVLTGYLALRWERRRGQEDCKNRIEALFHGMEMRDKIDHGVPITDEDNPA